MSIGPHPSRPAVRPAVPVRRVAPRPVPRLSVGHAWAFAAGGGLAMLLGVLALVIAAAVPTRATSPLPAVPLAPAVVLMGAEIEVPRPPEPVVLTRAEPKLTLLPESPPAPPPVPEPEPASPPRAEAPPRTVDDSCGTSVKFVNDPTEAGRKAAREQKLLFLLHVSGNFEDQGFT